MLDQSFFIRLVLHTALTVSILFCVLGAFILTAWVSGALKEKNERDHH